MNHNHNTLQPLIAEGRRRGYDDATIAARLGIAIEDLNPPPVSNTVTGMYGDEFVAQPDLIDDVSGMIERGRKSLQADTHDFTTALLRKPTRNESLALMVDALGLEGAHDYIAAAYHRIGGMDHCADSLHIPTASVRAVITGAWPTKPADEKISGGIANGLPRRIFAALPARIHKAILTIISRSNEATYRRGFQQGYSAAEKGKRLAIAPDKLRLGGFSLDRAPMPHCGTRSMSSLERLECEHASALMELGLTNEAGTVH